ncbi:MAG TPA: lysophospholipid acyltransferase family protein [Jatrophihabitantaceae bacterium]
MNAVFGMVDDAGMAGDRSLLMYRVVMAVATPIVRWWGRLEIVGLDALPKSGPLVLLANHDSHWDPVVVGVAGVRRRQIRALAKASLWRNRLLAWVLDHMGQIPIERGRGDAKALAAAIEQLRDGACIGVFPEGTVSHGRTLRALSGAGRLALAVPDCQVVCVVITGAVDIALFPRRPHLRVEFFEPKGGQPQPGESAVALTKRTMAEIRAIAPPVVTGRRRRAAAEQAAPDAAS